RAGWRLPGSGEGRTGLASCLPHWFAEPAVQHARPTAPPLTRLTTTSTLRALPSSSTRLLQTRSPPARLAALVPARAKPLAPNEIWLPLPTLALGTTTRPAALKSSSRTTSPPGARTMLRSQLAPLQLVPSVVGQNT